jgi:valyl-tRNA synthetase
VLLVKDKDAIATFECLQALTHSICNTQVEYNVKQGKKVGATIVALGHLEDSTEAEIKLLVMLVKLDPNEVAVLGAGSNEAKEAAASNLVQHAVQNGVEAYIPLSGLIDTKKERQRLEEQPTKLIKKIEKLGGRFNAKGFVDKVPPVVVIKVRAELAKLEDQASKVHASLL